MPIAKLVGCPEAPSSARSKSSPRLNISVAYSSTSLPGVGEAHATTDALEQRDPEPLFEHAELTAHGLRCHRQCGRGGGHRAAARHGAKVGELHEVEVPDVQLTIP